MKKIIYFFTIIYLFSSCKKLDVLPQSIVQDKDVFSNVGGVTAYMAGLYRLLPIEDFKYGANAGFNQYDNGFNSPEMYTGEGMNNHTGGESGGYGYFSDAYNAIRNINYFIQTMPTYASAINNPAQVNSWLGEAYFMRAYCYFALVKRYGGVPIIKIVQNYPQLSLEELQIPRNSEQESYDFIADDLDQAINLMGATSEVRGRANKYVAAAFKSRVMLFAGCIAEYNTINNVDPKTSKRVQGIASSEALRYFKAAYAASTLVAAGNYKLYRALGDKVQNYTNLFSDLSTANTEVIFAKEYSYPDVGHSYDTFAIPRQEQGKDGYGSFVTPTLDYVELFEGFPKNPDGTVKVTDANGKYIYYDDRYALFKNAEPRLLATITMPGSTFKGQVIDVRRGIYTGDISNGISKFPTTYNAIPGFSPALNKNGDPTVNIGGGQTLPSGGLSGVYSSMDDGTISGFFVKKYVNENLATADLYQGHSTQPWIEIRYAEVLLNRAEAAYELSRNYGQTDVNYLQDAYTQINDIRDRAGAPLLASVGQLSSIDTIRKERRKEIGWEHKIYWDQRRWRTADKDINNRVWYILNPIYVAANKKYIFDRRPDERNSIFTFSSTLYYQGIPASELSKNPKLVQNLNY